MYSGNLNSGITFYQEKGNQYDTSHRCTPCAVGIVFRRMF
jgi:hypothetical protein